MLTGTLRVIAPTWERARCPPTGEWLNCATTALWATTQPQRGRRPEIHNLAESPENYSE